MHGKLSKKSSNCACPQCDSLRCFGKRYRQQYRGGSGNEYLFLNNVTKEKMATEEIPLTRLPTDSEVGTIFYSSGNTLSSNTAMVEKNCNSESKNNSEPKIKISKSSINQRVHRKSSSDLETSINHNSLLQSLYGNRLDSKINKSRENQPRVGREFVKKLDRALKEKYHKEKVFEELIQCIKEAENQMDTVILGSKPGTTVACDALQNVGGDTQSDNILTKKIMNRLMDACNTCTCKVCECIDDFMSEPKQSLVHADTYKKRKQFQNAQCEGNVNMQSKRGSCCHSEKTDGFMKQKTLTKHNDLCVPSFMDLIDMGKYHQNDENVTLLVSPKKPIRWNICANKNLEFSPPIYDDIYSVSQVKLLNKNNYPWKIDVMESKDIQKVDESEQTDSEITHSKLNVKSDISKPQDAELSYTSLTINSSYQFAVLEVQEISAQLLLIAQLLDKALKTFDLVSEKWQTIKHNIKAPDIVKANFVNKAILFQKSTDSTIEAIKDYYKVLFKNLKANNLEISQADNKNEVLISNGVKLIKDKRILQDSIIKEKKNLTDTDAVTDNTKLQDNIVIKEKGNLEDKETEREMMHAFISDEINKKLMHTLNEIEFKKKLSKYKKLVKNAKKVNKFSQNSSKNTSISDVLLNEIRQNNLESSENISQRVQNLESILFKERRSDSIDNQSLSKLGASDIGTSEFETSVLGFSELGVRSTSKSENNHDVELMRASINIVDLANIMRQLADTFDEIVLEFE